MRNAVCIAVLAVLLATPGSPACTDVPIGCDEDFTGSLGSGDCVSANQYYDDYVLWATAARFSVEVTSQNGQPINVDMLDANGASILGGPVRGGTDPGFVLTLPYTGVYRIRVFATISSFPTPYRVQTGCAPENCRSSERASCPTTAVSNAITSFGCRSSSGFNSNYHAITLAAGETIKVSVEAAFPLWVYAYPDDGKTGVWIKDEPGDNSALFFTASSSGLHWVELTPAVRKAGGFYNLLVECPALPSCRSRPVRR